MPTIRINKEIKFSYEILEKFEAGLVLTGAEVKSTKLGHIQLKGSYITIHPDNTVWLINAHISKYKPAGTYKKHNPTRDKKLLLNKKEIDRLRGKLAQTGLTIVPIKVYTKGGLIKLEIALVRGLKKHDKRSKLKKRDIERDTQRAIKKYLY